MKYLLVLAVVFVAIWVWRHNRRVDADRADRSATPTRSAPPVAMVACRACGTHLPRSEAVPGRLGVYCCPEHHQRDEGAGG